MAAELSLGAVEEKTKRTVVHAVLRQRKKFTFTRLHTSRWHGDLAGFPERSCLCLARAQFGKDSRVHGQHSARLRVHRAHWHLYGAWNSLFSGELWSSKFGTRRAASNMKRKWLGTFLSNVPTLCFILFMQLIMQIFMHHICAQCTSPKGLYM